jgi:hypothetical protein
MLSARFVTVFGLAATVGFIIANCGGSDSSSTNNLNCPPSNTGAGTCSAEQTKAYSDCLQNKCDSAYQACFGSGYKSGSFGGACGTWIGCYAKCPCGDTACRGACGLPPADCQACTVNQLGPCQMNAGCTYPTCTGTGTGGSGGGTGGSGGGGAGGGGGGTCSDLAKCCNSLADASQKSACNMAVTGAMQPGLGDAYCGQILMVYRAGGVCK